MKQIPLFLFAFWILKIVSGQIANCVNKLPLPCTKTDTDCNQELSIQNQCLSIFCSEITALDKYASCILLHCESKSQAVNSYYSALVDCLNNPESNTGMSSKQNAVETNSTDTSNFQTTHSNAPNLIKFSIILISMIIALIY